MASICRIRVFHSKPGVAQKLSRFSTSTFARRQYSSHTNGTGIPSLDSSIFISKSHNPYFNLTLEDWLFRHKNPEHPLLLIYRDDPCVVIGRNQNPWKEVNFEALRARPSVPCIRRRSGGGTVYHDLGNTNFSIHLARTEFDRHATAQVILRAVRSLGVDARVNDRNDICIGSDKICSAYKIVNKRAYHHGTMLISTQLDNLGDILRTNKETMITRGVASVKSPVCNLHQYDTSITQETFSQAVVDEFKKEYGIHEEPCYVEENNAIKNLEYIQKGMKELPSWDWLYGQTPEFDYTVNHLFPWADATVKVKSKHGIILSCSIELTDLRPGEEFISSTPSRLSTPTAATISSSSTSESMPTTQQAPTSIPVVPTSASEILAMVKEVGESLEGKRYGFVDFCSGDGGSEVVPELDQQNEDQGVLISPVSPPPPPSSLPLRASSPTSSVTSTHLGKLRRDVEDLLRKVMDMKS